MRWGLANLGPPQNPLWGLSRQATFTLRAFSLGGLRTIVSHDLKVVKPRTLLSARRNTRICVRRSPVRALQHKVEYLSDP